MPSLVLDLLLRVIGFVQQARWSVGGSADFVMRVWNQLRQFPCRFILEFEWEMCIGYQHNENKRRACAQPRLCRSRARGRVWEGV